MKNQNQKNEDKGTCKAKKFKVSLMACFMLFILTGTNAQDKITMMNGTEISAKILEVGENEVKYKTQDNLNGPTHVTLKKDIFLIKYENGSKDVFNNETKTQTVVMPVPVYQTPANNQFDTDSSDFAKIRRKEFSGPRVGVTYISAGTSADFLASQGKQPLITQFGWQFERRLFTVDETSGIVEFIPLIGGVEQGMFIPSVSLLIGLRGGKHTPFEFALGPNLSVVPDYKGNKVGSLALVIGVGTSFKKGNINFPVNLAFVPSVGSTHNVYDLPTNTTSKQTFHTGWRLSLVVGFNSRKK